VDINNLVQTVAVYALPVLLGLTWHEAGHAYAARYLGGPGAIQPGKATLNPAAHIDPVGTVLMPLLMLFATAALPGGPMLLGYAKTVIYPKTFRNPKRDNILVTLAGPGSNFLQALLWALIGLALIGFDVNEDYFLRVANAGVMVNLVLAVFNLIPVPPLDGGKVLVELLPWKAGQALSRIEPYGFFVVLALIASGVLNTAWMRPLVLASFSALSFAISPLTSPFSLT
jgi:Zn-dependent protease